MTTAGLIAALAMVLLVTGCIPDLSPAPTPGLPAAAPSAPSAPEATPTGTATVRPATSPVPSAVPTGSVTASPAGGGSGLSVSEIQAAWQAKGLTVTSGEPVTTSGFSVTPAPFRVAKNDEVSTLLVFSYANERALMEDWLVGGFAPVPRSGKNPGTFEAAWWNQNAMVLLRIRARASADDAREAFLALGPSVPVVAPIPSGTVSGTVAATATGAAGTPRPGAPPKGVVPAATATRVPTQGPSAFPTLPPPR